MQFVQLEPRDRAGSSLLHLAATKVERFIAVARLLLDAGVDVDAVDGQSNAPLHVIASLNIRRQGHFELKVIVDRVHVDVVNKAGLTPLQVAEASNCAAVAALLKRHVAPLKCLASRVLKGYPKEYVCQMPRTLEAFLLLHG